MKHRYKNNPWLTIGLVMELIYLCTGHLAPVERLLGDHLGSFLCGVWQGITIALLLLGLLAMASPDFRKKAGSDLPPEQIIRRISNADQFDDLRI